MYSRRTYSKVALPLNCNDDDLRSIVEGFIEQSDFDFTFNSLINYIIRHANQNDLFDKDTNVKYAEIVLNGIDVKRINLLIWDMICDRKIIIDFFKEKDPGNNDCRFIKMD